MDNIELANGAQTESRAFNFALPTALKNEEEIVFLVQHNMPIHNVETCGDNATADWVRLKRRNQRIRSIRKQAELLVKLKAVIHRAHKESLDESGIPICQMSQNWREHIKREHLMTPILPPMVKVKEESTTPLCYNLYPFFTLSHAYSALTHIITHTSHDRVLYLTLAPL